MSDHGQKLMIKETAANPFETGGLRSYLQYRDLGVLAATGGKYHAHIIRPNGPCPPGGAGRHVHKLDFQLNYVLKGEVTMWLEGQGEVTIKEGGCWLQPPEIVHDLLGYSDDAEWLEVTSPGEFGTELA